MDRNYQNGVFPQNAAQLVYISSSVTMLFFMPSQHLLLLLLLLMGLLLVVLLVHLHNLIGLLLVGIPLASLQDQDTDEQKSQDGIAGSENLERILSSKIVAGIINLALCESRVAVDARGDNAHALDNVGNVNGDTAHVQYKTGAVEEEVGLRRLVQLGDEAQETGSDDNVEDARDERRGCVDELEVVLEHLVVGQTRVYSWDKSRGCRPQNIVVVREGCEKDSQEETRSCGMLSVAIVWLV